MIKRGTFKATDLLKIPCPTLDETLTNLLAHIVRCAGDREKLALIQEALLEIDQFIAEAKSEDLAVN